jgi:hypothetical protein
MKPRTWTHPKFSMLCATLESGRAATAGILEGIWHLAATFDPDGGKLPYQPRQLAAWLEIDIDPDTLTAALVDCGWLEGSAGAYLVHDWEDHKPSYIRDAERKRRQRGTMSRDSHGTVTGRHVTVCDNPCAAVPSDSDSVCKTEVSNDTSSQQAPPAGINGHVFVLPLTGGCSYRIPSERITEYAAAFKWDVRAEISKAALWLKDNPSRRPKTHRSAAAFLTRWLNRRDDKERASGPRGESGGLSADEYRKDLAKRTKKTLDYVNGR